MGAYSTPEDPPTTETPSPDPKVERKRTIARLANPSAEASPDGDPKTWASRVTKIGTALGKPYLDALAQELSRAA